MCVVHSYSLISMVSCRFNENKLFFLNLIAVKDRRVSQDSKVKSQCYAEHVNPKTVELIILCTPDGNVSVKNNVFRTTAM